MNKPIRDYVTLYGAKFIHLQHHISECNRCLKPLAGHNISFITSAAMRNKTIIINPLRQHCTEWFIKEEI